MDCSDRLRVATHNIAVGASREEARDAEQTRRRPRCLRLRGGVGEPALIAALL